MYIVHIKLIHRYAHMYTMTILAPDHTPIRVTIPRSLVRRRQSATRTTRDDARHAATRDDVRRVERACFAPDRTREVDDGEVDDGDVSTDASAIGEISRGWIDSVEAFARVRATEDGV